MNWSDVEMKRNECFYAAANEKVFRWKSATAAAAVIATAVTAVY